MDKIKHEENGPSEKIEESKKKDVVKKTSDIIGDSSEEEKD